MKQKKTVLAVAILIIVGVLIYGGLFWFKREGRNFDSRTMKAMITSDFGECPYPGKCSRTIKIYNNKKIAIYDKLTSKLNNFTLTDQESANLNQELDKLALGQCGQESFIFDASYRAEINYNGKTVLVKFPQCQSGINKIIDQLPDRIYVY